MLIFFLALTLGFSFELGKNALKIDSRQMITLIINKLKSVYSEAANITATVVITVVVTVETVGPYFVGDVATNIST
jgi:hypothetical protein